MQARQRTADLGGTGDVSPYLRYDSSLLTVLLERQERAQETVIDTEIYTRRPFHCKDSYIYCMGAGPDRRGRAQCTRLLVFFKNNEFFEEGDAYDEQVPGGPVQHR